MNMKDGSVSDEKGTEDEDKDNYIRVIFYLNFAHTEYYIIFFESYFKIFFSEFSIKPIYLISS